MDDLSDGSSIPMVAELWQQCLETHRLEDRMGDQGQLVARLVYTMALSEACKLISERAAAADQRPSRVLGADADDDKERATVCAGFFLMDINELIERWRAEIRAATAVSVIKSQTVRAARETQARSRNCQLLGVEACWNEMREAEF